MNRIISYTFFLLSVMTGGFAKIYANTEAPENTIVSTSDFSNTIIIVLQVLALFVVVGGFLCIKIYIRNKVKNLREELEEMHCKTTPQINIPNKVNNDALKSDLLKTKEELREANELNNKLEQENSDLNKQISDLKSETKNLECKLEETKKLESCSDLNNAIVQNEPVNASNNQEDEYFDREDLDRYYIETPSEEKLIFQSKLSKEFVARDHSYEVVIDRNKPNYAKFRIFKDANFRRMIEQPNRFITPACECGDTSFESHNGFEMIEAGTLELNGEEWKLVEKAKIKLI